MRTDRAPKPRPHVRRVYTADVLLRTERVIELRARHGSWRRATDKLGDVQSDLRETATLFPNLGEGYVVTPTVAAVADDIAIVRVAMIHAEGRRFSSVLVCGRIPVDDVVHVMRCKMGDLV